jgi:hypothetical protein
MDRNNSVQGLRQSEASPGLSFSLRG